MPAVVTLQQLKFAVVGVLNTLIHFLILNALVFGFGVDKIWAGVFAALSAMLFSFAANRRYVFQSSSKNLLRQISVFFAGTLVGAFVFNYGTYVLMLHGFDLVRSVVLEQIPFVTPTLFDILQINVSLIVGSVVALVWNYHFYNRVVFRDREARGTSVIDPDNKL